ncbi:DeoR/GlpR family DNA-binding transcription regulator [Zafaria sp. Z1313]|uniref:DeoR/GlpR family DNA-binding transcription regulator n=1 Tax=unclassified Zafaria TaxID=2828765 RepID=UPI002E79F7B3|nr:DeoR/GlpR family DNA-binding transcription regulator [Zafaria sp. J156]MEE1620033.1 DeoR/GlpR family DNA-binding transcription regulator [Zafaria sp. J156]
MQRSERLREILNLLAEEGQLEVGDVVDRLGISPATARRDLDSLAAQRLLTRTHGGATTNTLSFDLPGKYTRDAAAGRKRAIAAFAGSLVSPGMSIGLTGGTTCSAIATHLGLREDLADPSGQPGITVVTNSVNIATTLAVRSHVKVMATGGVLNPSSYELVGSFAEQSLQRVSLDLAFIGVGGIDAEGPTVHDEAEAAVNSLMAARAARAYVVADSSKIGRRAFVSLEGARFGHVVTDADLDEAQRALLEGAGYEVVVAEDAADDERPAADAAQGGA